MPENTQLDPDTTDIEKYLRAIRPEPGRRFHARMARAPWIAPRAPGAGLFQTLRTHRFATLAAVILILAAALAVTPAGGVFASQVMKLFSRSAGNTLPLPPDQVFTPVPSATPAPTHVVALQPADQVVTLAPTARPTPDGERTDDISLLEAQTLAGFDLYQPLRLPRDYRLTRITFDPVQQSVSLWYASPQAAAGEFFLVTQGTYMDPLSIGPDAPVESVAVGEYTAEFVRGQWFIANGAGEAVWEDQAEIYTLRWQAGKVTLSLQFFLNEPSSPAYLDREEMIALARDLARCPENDGVACQVSQAAAAAGFVPWQFPETPEGLTFRRVDYRAGLTALWYGGDTGEYTFLQSTHPFTDRETEPWSLVPEGAVQAVSVAGQPGEYVRGAFMPQPGENAVVWDPQAATERLRWQQGEWWFQIVRTGSPAPAAQSLAALAEQLSPGAAPAQADRTPEVGTGSDQPVSYTRIADLEAAAGVDVREPGLLPAGLPFDHAWYEPFSGGTLLFYGDFTPDQVHANGPVLIVSQTPRTVIDGDPGDFYPPEAIQAVEVNGFPGQFLSGSLNLGSSAAGQPTPAPAWNPDSGTLILTWKTADMTFSINFNPSSGGERITPQELLKIAESLQ